MTIGIGGNDTGFGPIIVSCIMSLTPCPDVVLPELGPEPLELTVPKLITGDVRRSIIQTVQAIHNKAPNAEIVLMGYPKVIGAPCELGPGLGVINSTEVAWIKSATDAMDDMLLELPEDITLRGINLKVADPRPFFGLDGEHGACTGDGNEAIHELVIDLTPGDEALLPPKWLVPGKSAQSFHPNLEMGTDLYAQALNSVWATGA